MDPIVQRGAWKGFWVAHVLDIGSLQSDVDAAEIRLYRNKGSFSLGRFVGIVSGFRSNF